MPRRRRRNDPGEPHATDAQVNGRVEEVLRIRLDGAELWDIREYVREKVEKKDPVWGEHMLSDSQLYRYIRRANAMIAESCKPSRKRVVQRHLAQRRALFGRCINSGDYRTALAVLRDEAELLLLYGAPELDEMKAMIEELKRGQCKNGDEAAETGADGAGGEATLEPLPPADETSPQIPD